MKNTFSNVREENLTMDSRRPVIGKETGREYRCGVPLNVLDVARRIRGTSDPRRVLAQLRLSLAEGSVQDVDDSQ